jgi:hypothetical protein
MLASGGSVEPLLKTGQRLSPWLQRNEEKVAQHRWKVIISYSYCLAMGALGLVYAAQGPATITLAEQCGIVTAPTGNQTINTSNLPQLGLANALDSAAGVVGGFLGGWLVDHTPRWHRMLSIYLFMQGLAFVAFTLVTDFTGLLAASLLWGWSSTLTSLATQAAMTWLWGARSAPWLQLNNAAFGIGALVAPALVSWDLNR